MAEQWQALMEMVSIAFEVVGVGCIIAGLGIALFVGGRLAYKRRGTEAYNAVRSIFGRSVLLGLEFLVAADLIRTIAVAPTLDNLYVLGLLVLIRTFLSWSLDVELEGVWPWRKREAGIMSSGESPSSRHLK